ncbi:MAG: TfoX/Sxy family protein [Marinomonas sp.]|jgi:TfoX/Sxy family transcriptional regulator of competence genes|uniref:TfoX/Sxy family protein n=1 Tax=unclassified Marinomonas TaxID=196814 RepID=UPI0005FA3906|nr:MULTISPECIES: TfoX/Sxy family protein [unclassified Marinomonas]KJZ15349.1 hypothetical protein TW85_04680 [Marinomonas sp. S3726]KZM39707.1 hypothetical protein OA92_18770 [Marinomonas sp. SBI22]KZM41083.1 hypothetical protein OA91_18005 [Marinomonas sp. SBI8L]
MKYETGLVQRIKAIFDPSLEFQEKEMFGGYCFLFNRHMCIGVIGNSLLARIGPEHYAKSLAKNYVKQFDFVGRPMADVVCVEAELIESDEELKQWLDMSFAFVKSLPAKVSQSEKVA